MRCPGSYADEGALRAFINEHPDPEPEPPKGNPVTVDLFGPRLQQLLNSLDITIYPAQERIIWNLLQAERKAPTMAASSIWTEVTDLTTLKEGDHIKVTHDTTLLEITLGAPVEGPDEEGDYLINLAGLACSDVFVPAEGSKFFIKETPFAPLGRALNPGEVVEDRNGMRYILNPLNSNLVVHSAQGEDVLGFAYTEVRPVR